LFCYLAACGAVTQAMSRRMVVPVSVAVTLASSLLLSGCGSSGGVPDAPTAPATTTSTSSSTTTTAKGPTESCLCVFDIDRTLTGTQGDTTKCPDNLEKKGVADIAYGLQSHGDLTLSALAQHVGDTFCAACYRGICSSGVSSGKNDKEREVLLQAIGGSNASLSSTWSDAHIGGVKSALVLNAQHGAKEKAVRQIVDWFATQDVLIPDKQVYFFDDDEGNVKPFEQTGFNAHHVSCVTRDTQRGSSVGYCGATPAEVKRTSGVTVCQASEMV